MHPANPAMEAQAQAAESSVDKSLTKDAAFKNAVLAAELYMEAVRSAPSDDEKSRLRRKCERLLSRAEEIKAAVSWAPSSAADDVLPAPRSERLITRSEEIILLEGSKLHGHIFPPWTSDPEDSVFDAGPIYTDPVDLKLSDAQRDIFAGWKRPIHIFGWPLDDQHQTATQDYAFLMATSREIDLVQDITTDCSVVASLCAGTARALKGHGKLLASTIYPYDKSNRRPRVSKSGKYIFRFHFNGCFRKVTIDDRLPASNSTRSLHVIDRRNPQLLWPALIEKAYLKVRGGYDFPGSNSGTDLWVLTGWIPEQVFLQSDDLQPEQSWSRILKSFGFGDVMITLGTGKLSCKEERELGLAGEHDYAVLDMKESGSQRSFLIKNPWCDGMTFKGYRDTDHAAGDSAEVRESLQQVWTKDLRETLPRNPPTAPGTFWMSYEDVIQNFESLYLNWNPGLFLYRQDYHFSWTIPSITNPGSFTHNPQYSVQTDAKATVWILLSRHFATGEHKIVQKKSDIPVENASSLLGFISLYVFEAGGRRVYLSDDAFYRGSFVDSPQTLARLEMAASTPYTIVAAQHALPLPRYSFTLSFFSRLPLMITPAADALPHFTIHRGLWSHRTAGGNANSSSYPINPQFSISIPSATDLTLILESDVEELAVHVKMVWAHGERVTAVTVRDILGGSGDYRRGCALATLRNVTEGKYTIVCSTFEAGQTGSFTLRVGSMVPCEVKPVLAEEAGRLSLRLPVLAFRTGVDRMLAPLTMARITRLRIVARCGRGRARGSTGTATRSFLKLSLERGQGPDKVLLSISGNGEFSDALTGVRIPDVDVSPGMGYSGGLWIVVERLGGRGIEVDDVDVEILSDRPVQVGLWGTGESDA